MIIFDFLESFPEWISSKVYYYKRISMTSDIFDPLESFSQWTSLIKLLKFYFPYRWYFSIFLKIFSRLNLIENPSHIYIRQFKRNNKFNNLRSSTNHPSTLSTNIFRSSEKSFPKWTSLKIVTFIFANFYSTSVIFFHLLKNLFQAELSLKIPLIFIFPNSNL